MTDTMLYIGYDTFDIGFDQGIVWSGAKKLLSRKPSLSIIPRPRAQFTIGEMLARATEWMSTETPPSLYRDSSRKKSDSLWGFQTIKNRGDIIAEV